MASRLNPYLNFDGTTAEAMRFYQSVFGGDLTISTFGDMGAPEGVDPEGTMHAVLETPSGFTLMASDPPPHFQMQAGNNFSVSLSGDDDDALSGYWAGLSDGGQVLMDLTPSPWGDRFGMLVDKHGIQWLVNITGAETSAGDTPPS